MQPAAEASILVFNTGESQLLDLMEGITRQYSSLKLFYRNSVHATSVEEILDEALVAKQILYLHFRSKNGLFENSSICESSAGSTACKPS